MAYTGQSLKRFEDPRLITGQGTYTDDIKLPGMLYASFLRSPHAHARIKSIDTTTARNMPGVVAVLTADDLAGKVPDIPTMTIKEWEMDFLRGPEVPILARDKVCYVGQAVAVAVAQERYLAKDASELIKVDYETLPVMMDPLEAVKDDSVNVHEEFGTNITMRKFNDRQGSALDDAFAQADRVVRQQYTVQRLAAVPMETRGCVAHYEPQDDFLTIWASTQSAHNYRHEICDLLGRPEDKVCVITPDVGGGFGEKHGAFPEDYAIAYLSLYLGQPVNWIADRQENQLAFHGRGHCVDLEAAVKNDGTILGIRMKNVVDGGGFCGNSTQVPPYTSSHRILGPYKTATARIEVLPAITNKGLTGTYRGAGGPEAAFCMERTMDLVAKELSLDPADVRRKNFIAPDEFPYETPTGIFYDSGEYDKSLDCALELSDYRSWQKKARDSVSTEGPLIGVGLATCVKMGGAAGSFRIEDAWINIDSSGKVTTRTGVSPHGQGSDITFAQIVADKLGRTPYDVEVLHGDTDVVPSGLGTGATRGMVVRGSAMALVAKDAREKLAQIAFHMLKCSAADVSLEDGRAYNRENPGQSVTFAEVASAAYNEELLPPAASCCLSGPGFPQQIHAGGRPAAPQSPCLRRSCRCGRGRQGHRRGENNQVRGRFRLRTGYQSDDRGRAGPRRDSARNRSGAHRGHGLHSGWSAPHGDFDGLRYTRGRRDAKFHNRSHRDSLPSDTYRCEGDRRDAHGRGAWRGGECGDECFLPCGSTSHRDASYSREDMARSA